METKVNPLRRVAAAIRAQITALAGRVQALEDDPGGVATVNGLAPDGAGNVTLTTANVGEQTNLYYTDLRARSAPLTGLSLTNTAITATASILTAFGRTQGQINALSSGKATLDANRKVVFPNAAGTFNTTVQSLATAARDVKWPDKSGTVAMLDDVGGQPLMVKLVDMTIPNTNSIVDLDWPTIFADNPGFDDFIIQGDGVVFSNGAGVLSSALIAFLTLDGSTYPGIAGWVHGTTSNSGNTSVGTNFMLTPSGFGVSFVHKMMNVQKDNANTAPGGVPSLSALKSFETSGRALSNTSTTASTSIGTVTVTYGILNPNIAAGQGAIKGIRIRASTGQYLVAGRIRIFGVRN